MFYELIKQKLIIKKFNNFHSIKLKKSIFYSGIAVKIRKDILELQFFQK